MSDQRCEIQKRRSELLELIASGENALLASKDDRTRRSLDAKLTAMRNELQVITTQLMTKPVESFNEFVRRHGGKPVFDPSIKGELFSDGAVWMGPRHTGSGMEPTPDTENLKRRRRYYQLRIDAEGKAFEKFKAECVQQANWHSLYPSSCPPPPQDAEEQLSTGAQRIFKLRCELRAIAVELERLPDAVARREYEEGQRQQSVAARQRLNTLMGIAHDGALPPEPVLPGKK